MKHSILAIVCTFGLSYAAPVVASAQAPVVARMDQATVYDYGDKWLILGGWTAGDGVATDTIFCIHDRVFQELMGDLRGCWNPFPPHDRIDVYNYLTGIGWNVLTHLLGVAASFNLTANGLGTGDYYVYTLGVQWVNGYPHYTGSNAIPFTVP